jgi:trehalose-6-phosphate synthase
MEFTMARKMHGTMVEMGVVPRETVQIGLPHQGLIIVGEFISSSRAMRWGILVNPWRVDEV